MNWLVLVHRSVTAGPGTGLLSAASPGTADPAVNSRQYGSCPSVPILNSVSAWPAGSSLMTHTVTVKKCRSCSSHVRTAGYLTFTAPGRLGKVQWSPLSHLVPSRSSRRLPKLKCAKSRRGLPAVGISLALTVPSSSHGIGQPLHGSDRSLAVLIADADDLGTETARLTPVKRDQPEAIRHHSPLGHKPYANRRGGKARATGGRLNCCRGEWSCAPAADGIRDRHFADRAAEAGKRQAEHGISDDYRSACPERVRHLGCSIKAARYREQSGTNRDEPGTEPQPKGFIGSRHARDRIGWCRPQIRAAVAPPGRPV